MDFLANQRDRNGLHMLSSESTYFDSLHGFRMILDEESIAKAVQKIADVINGKRFEGKRIVLCGVLKGCFVFMADLMKRLTRPYSVYFVEAWSYSGKHQKEVTIATTLNKDKLQDKHVIILDELLDRGHTMDKVVTHLQKELSIPRSQMTTCVLFEKNVLRDASLEADIVGLRGLPNVWLVGYGLDDGGTKRGWPFIYAQAKDNEEDMTEDDALFGDEDFHQSVLDRLSDGLK